MRSRRLGEAGERYWVVDGSPPTDRDLHRISQRPLVHVLNMPRGTTTLDFLEPVVSVLDRLIVTDWSCTDSRILSRAVNLTELDLWTDERHTVKFAALQRLRTVAFDWQPELSAALSLTSVHQVMLTHPPSNLVELLGPNVASLRLNQASKVGSARRMPLGLKAFEIAGTSKFDAASLDQHASLRSLTIADVREVLGLVALSQTLQLDSLTLENIEDLDDADQLASLRARSVLCIGPLFTQEKVVAALRSAPITKLRLPPRR